MYFILLEDYTCHWTLEPPRFSTWSKTYSYSKWNTKIHFISCCPQMKPYCHRDLSTSSTPSTPSSKISNISLLKSHVQKTFRRCETDACLSGFKSLCRLSCNAALKRLIIIIMEDGVFLPCYTACIWLHLCSMYFSYQLTELDYSYIMSCINFACTEFKLKYPLFEISQEWPETKEDKEAKTKKYSDNTFHESILNIPNERTRNMALALKLYNDKNIFKLEGDKILAYYTIETHISYLMNIPEINFSTFVKIDDVQYLSKENITIVACDFHVDYELPYIVQKMCPNYKIEFIKSCIWFMSSRINKRQSLKLYLNQEEKTLKFENEIYLKYSTFWDKYKISILNIMLQRMLRKFL